MKLGKLSVYIYDDIFYKSPVDVSVKIFYDIVVFIKIVRNCRKNAC